MHAVELATGKEVSNFPVAIEGEAQNLPGVQFEPFQELQRPALLMMNGVIYAAFGSHCDREPYEGWIVGVSTAGHVTTKWAASAHGGSIWQSGGGLVSDGSGQILFSTGNDNEKAGKWDPPKGPGNKPPEGKLGESVVRVEVQSKGELTAKDFFSPFDNKTLDEGDIDLGSSAPVALPSQFGKETNVPHLLVQEGKSGYVYLLNREQLGGMGEGLGGEDDVVQRLGPYGGVWGTAAVWPGDGGYVYIPSVAPIGGGESSGHLHVFKYEVENATPKLSLVSTTPDEMWFGSGSPIVTSNGTASGTGLMWIPWCPTGGCHGAELRAYQAVPSSSEPKPIWSRPIGFANKFSRPYAAEGHVYVGNREGDVFGFSGPALTSSSESLELAAPVGEQATGEVTLTSTGTKLKVAKVTKPTVPFEVNGVPEEGKAILPGEVIHLLVTFKPSSRGPVERIFVIETEAGNITITLKGSGEESAKEKAERDAKERTEREAREKIEREARGKASTRASTVSLVKPLLGAGPLTVEPILTNLKIRSSASRLNSHLRKLVITYSLSTVDTVRLTVYRRLISHHCKRGVRTCVRWVATKIKEKVAGHIGANMHAMNLGALPAGNYRLAATPVTRSSSPGVTRYVYFKTFH
jgi:hypothetical protein